MGLRRSLRRYARLAGFESRLAPDSIEGRRSQLSKIGMHFAEQSRSDAEAALESI